MSSKSKSDKSEIPKSQKQKRSFLPRLPSFRKKKSAPQGGSGERTQKSPKVTKEEPVMGRGRGAANVMRRSKTSELVASFEKRLSDLEDESNANAKVDNSKVVKQTTKSPSTGTSKFSRFGFKGIAAHRISSFENRNNNGNGENIESKPEEINANSPIVHKPARLSNRNYDQADITRSGSTSSAKSPDSDCSSPLTPCTKVLGLPMPYRSVFADEPRGLKRQASSQSVDPISSGISTASTSSTPSPCVETMLAVERGDMSTQRAMLNTTFSLSEPRGLNKTYSKEPYHETFTKDDSSGSGFTTGVLSYKTKDIKHALISSSSEPATPASQQELKLVEETPISQSECVSLSAAVPSMTPRPVTGSEGVNSGHVHRQHGDLDRTNSTGFDHKPSLSDSVCASPADKSVDTMGSTQSVDPCAISTPARPLHLSLTKPHLSAIRHASESFESAELESLGSDDLMCDSRYLDDSAVFDALLDEHDSRLSRSYGMEPMLHKSCHNGNRSRTSSLNQVNSDSLDKRVNLSRGLSIPSPLGLTPSCKKRGNRPASRSVSAVDELGQLISATFVSDTRHQHNTNRNRSNSSLTTHPLRPPRWMSHQEDDDDVVVVDATVYRHMIQDITYLKTMLLRLKRALQQSETTSPFDHSLRSPFNSVPSSPMSDAFLLPTDTSVADLAEENQVLRKEVKKLQELLVDKESHLNTLSKQLARPDNRNTGTQCSEDTESESSSSVEVLSPASSCTDKCLQVDLPLNGQQVQLQSTFYEHQQQQQQQPEMEDQQHQSAMEQNQEHCHLSGTEYSDEKSEMEQCHLRDQQCPDDTTVYQQQTESRHDVYHHQDDIQRHDPHVYHYPEDTFGMSHSESMTSSSSSLTSEETRSSCRSLTSPTKRMEVQVPLTEELELELQHDVQQLPSKESSDDLSSSDNAQKPEMFEMQRQPAGKPEAEFQSKLTSPGMFRTGSPKRELSPTKQRQGKPSSNEAKEGLAKKKQKSKSRLVAPSSVSAKVLSQERKNKEGDSRGMSRTRKPVVTEIETVVSTSWEPLVDATSRTKYKSITTHAAGTKSTGSTKSSVPAPTAYSSYQHKSGLRAPSQRINQMALHPPKPISTYHPSSGPSSCSGSNERLSDAPVSPKRSSPQHSLRTTLAQPVPVTKKSGLPSPKRARQIPMGVTQMQSQMAASSQNKSPKRSSPSPNGRRENTAVLRPTKTQDQVWEKHMNGSNFSEQGMRGVHSTSPQTSPQRQQRQPGSKIAIPIRGRGGSKLPRTSIPSSRKFDPNM